MGAVKSVVKAVAPIVASAINPALGAAVGGILGATQKGPSRAQVRQQSFVPQGEAQPDPAAEAAAKRKAVRIQLANQGNQSRFFGGGSDSRFFG